MINKTKILTHMVTDYWIVYGKCHKGWRNAYAKHMLNIVQNEKVQSQELEILYNWLKQHDPSMLQSRKYRQLKLKLFLFRSCCGALLTQDSLDQIHTPYRYLRRLVTNGRTNFIGNRLNSQDAHDLCNNKARSAEYWHSWFKRKWDIISSNHPLSAAELNSLLNGKNKIVVKPLKCYGGTGVDVLNIAEQFDTQEQCLQYLNQMTGEHIVEEYVEQKGFLHHLNTSSVNTIRIVTGRNRNGDINFLNAFLRVGKKDSVVDNLSSGGKYYVVDISSGKIREGADAQGQCLIKPLRTTRESGFPKIPCWEEVLEFCRSAHQFAPQDLKYAGWDVCVSEDNILLIEVNNVPGQSQAFSPRDNPWRKMRKLLDESD